jgi:hypothetical protein
MFELLAAFLIWAIRGWCTLRGRVRIIRRPNVHGYISPNKRTLRIGEPYLIRYALFGWLPGDEHRASWLPNIYLHNILLPDSDLALHNHPWPWAISLILSGAYAEMRFDDLKVYCPGQLNRISANTFHRIVDVHSSKERSGAWTLFITSGGKRQPWGFDVPGQGFTPHRERKAFGLNREERRPFSNAGHL